MKRMIYIAIVLVCLGVIYAQPELEQGAAQPVDWNDARSDNDQNFLRNFEKDPAGGFKKNPDKAWETLNFNPSLMANNEVLDQAFLNNKKNAAEILDKNPSLIVRTNIADRLNFEAINNPWILNENPQASKALLAFKYKINNEGSLLHSFDGKYIGTGDPTRNVPVEKFVAADFPGARITKDGALKPTKELEMHGGAAYKDDKRMINVENGWVNSGKDSFLPYPILSIDGNSFSSDKAFLLITTNQGKTEIYEFKGSLTKTADGRGYTANPRTELTKYTGNEFGVLKFGPLIAGREINFGEASLDETFKNCRIGSDCVSFNPSGSGISIFEGGGASIKGDKMKIVRTSYQPADKIKIQEGYLLELPALNGFSAQTPNGKISIGSKGDVSYSPTNGAEKQIGTIWHEDPTALTPKQPALKEALNGIVNEYGVKVGPGYLSIDIKTEKHKSSPIPGASLRYTFILP